MANEFKVRKGLIVQGSGSTGDNTILDVQGNQGQLFSITDSLSGSLFSVGDISGIPILEVFSDEIVKIGTFGSEGLIVNGSNITASGNISSSGNISITGDITGSIGKFDALSADDYTIGAHIINDIDVGTEFSNADDHLMSAGAIKEKIEDYGYTTNVGTVTGVTTGDSNTITIGGTSAAPTVAANTAAVSDGGSNLATGDQIYDHVTTRISGLTSNAGTVTGTGTDNRIALWNGTTAIDSDSDFYVDGDTIFTTNLEASNIVAASEFRLDTLGDAITFYGGGQLQHSIMARDASGTAADDLRINSYGAVYINLDSNDNNTSTADFVVGNHGDATGTINTLFTLSGEDGDATFSGTIGSGAITSTGKITGTELEGTSLDINGGAAITGEVKIDSTGTALLILRGDSGNSGDTGQLDSQIKFLHDDETHGILMNVNNYAGKQSFEIKSLSSGTESSRFLIHQDNYIVTSGAITASGGISASDAVFSGTVTANGTTLTGATDISGKQDTITGAATTIDDANLTANRAVISNGSGKIAVSDVTSTELGYLDTVSSNIQTQLDAKAGTGDVITAQQAQDISDNKLKVSNATHTGDVTGATALTIKTNVALAGNPTTTTQTAGNDSTRIATTAFVGTAIDNLIGTAGSTLDTLGELSASLADTTSSLNSLVTTVGTKLAKLNNLSDLANAGTARSNLGLGTAATTAASDYATAAQGTTADNALAAASNLSDLANAGTARSNLGLGTAATTAATAYATSVQGDTADAALAAASNLSDLANVGTARSNLGLGDIVTENASSFATSAQGTKADDALPEADVDADIKTLSLPANTTISNFGKTLIDDADASAARTTLGLGTGAVLNTATISDGGTGLATADQIHTFVTDFGYTTNTGTVTGVTSGNSNTITIGGTSAAPTVAANTAAVSNNGSNLATGDQIYDHVTTRISGLTSNIGTVTEVTVGTGLDVSSGTSTPDITLDLSEFTDMTADVVGSQDELILLDNGAERRKLINEIKLSQFNNDSGFTGPTDISGKLTKSSNLSDLTNASTARTNLGVDAAGTDNSTPVTLSGTPDYITISGQTITRNQIDLTADVTGVLPDGNLSANTAHLSGTQTFSGAKTFSSNITANGNIVGDNSTNITGISTIEVGDGIANTTDNTTKIAINSLGHEFLIADDTVFELDSAKATLSKRLVSTQITASGNISSSKTVQGLTGSFSALVGDTSQATSLEVAGPITASGGIISDNIETFWTSFNVDGDGDFADSAYGPNTQGINYYFWNRNWTSTTADSGDPTGDHVHRTEINSGWYVPYKIKVVGFCGGLHDGNGASTTTCTVKLFNTVASITSDYDSNTGTTKALVASSGNVTLNGNRWKAYDISGLSVTLSEGQYILPRITMGENLTNLRGQFTIKYKRVV